MNPHVDLEFYFDPVCPFCWVTSRWVVEVASQRPVEVRWRPISLWLLNQAGADPQTPLSRLHQEGLALLRVVSAAERDHGPGVVGPLYSAIGTAIWEAGPPEGPGFDAVALDIVAGRDLPACLRAVGLPASLAAARDDHDLDVGIQASTDTALARVGDGVGTPVLAFDPPDGPAFFGPVLSRVPRGQAALEVWDAVVTLARTPSFAELKRTMRQLPALPLLSALDG